MDESNKSGSAATLAPPAQGGFIKRYVQWFERWMPDSMVIVLMLTLVVALIAGLACGSPIIFSAPDKISLVDAWAGGFWGLLDFSMQMTLIMITGSMFANAPPVKKALVALARIPNTQNQAFLMSLIVGTMLSWLHWGLGTMGGIVIGLEILVQAKDKGYKIHMPAFIGLMVCRLAFAGAGLSQSAALFATTPGRLAALVPAEYADRIPLFPLTETVLQPLVFFQIVALSVVSWFFIQFMLPKNEADYEEISDEFCAKVKKGSEMPKADRSTFAGLVNHSYLITIAIAGAGLWWIGGILYKRGISGLSINNYNFIVLMLGMLLNGTPAKVQKCVVDSVGSTWGIIIQFPFYAGIFGIISSTGLAHLITQLFINVSSQGTFPAIAYLYSATLNMFVPSGGSKFIIEAPYIIPAAIEVGASIPSVINAYIFGDLTTNIIQPFWLLPMITMFKTKFSRIMPYSLIFASLALVFQTIVFLLLY